jgi:hypothetical protein
MNSLQKRIKDNVSRESANIAVLLPCDHPSWARAHEIPEIASSACRSDSAVARVLLVRGLVLIEDGTTLPTLTAGRATTFRVAKWVDQYLYELACERRLPMRHLAQMAILTALDVLDT